MLFDGAELPGAYSSVAFLFAITLFMFSLHSSIDRPSRFTRSLSAGYAMAIVFNISFALLGYAIFGGAVSIIVVNSLPQTAIFSKVIQAVLGKGCWCWVSLLTNRQQLRTYSSPL